MKQKQRQTLTESLRSLELEVDSDRCDLVANDTKLNIAYAYEDELIVRLNTARKETKELQLANIEKRRLILKKFDQMKNIMDIWTGNFLKH